MNDSLTFLLEKSKNNKELTERIYATRNDRNPQLRGLLYFMTSTHLGSLNKAQRNKIRHVSAFV